MPDYAKFSLLRYRWVGQAVILRELISTVKGDPNWHKTKTYKGMIDALRPILVETKEVEKDLRGAPLSGADLLRAHLSGADLLKANLSGAYLKEADLSGANLWGADLSKANLRAANLSRANLWGCNFSGADMTEADLSGTNLSEANFSGADLWKANLSGANLREADLSGANLWETDLSGAELEKVIYSTDEVFNRIRKWWAPYIFHRIPFLNRFKHVQDWKAVGITILGGIDTAKMNGSRNPVLKRYIEDYQFIQGLKKKSWIHQWVLYPLWKITSDCGRSFTLWLMWTTAIIGFFCIAYSCYLADYFAHVHSKWLGIWYFSVMKFTTFGLHPLPPDMGTAPTRIWVMSETIAGYFMLGVLISILLNKIARRS